MQINVIQKPLKLLKLHLQIFIKFLWLHIHITVTLLTHGNI